MSGITIKDEKQTIELTTKQLGDKTEFEANYLAREFNISKEEAKYKLHRALMMGCANAQQIINAVATVIVEFDSDWISLDEILLSIIKMSHSGIKGRIAGKIISDNKIEEIKKSLTKANPHNIIKIDCTNTIV